MKISTLMIATIFFSSLLVGMFNFYSTLADKHGVSYTSSSSINNTVSTIQKKASELQNVTESVGRDISGFNPALIYDTTVLFVKTISILSTVPAIIGVLVNSILGFGGFPFTIPPWFITLVGSAIAIYVVFRLISLFTRKDM